MALKIGCVADFPQDSLSATPALAGACKVAKVHQTLGEATELNALDHPIARFARDLERTLKRLYRQLGPLRSEVDAREVSKLRAF